MEVILEFFKQFGLPLTLIALAGVIILGVMKYCKVFDKFDEKTRHLMYLGISIGITLVGCVVYLLVTKSFTWEGMAGIVIATYGLNQAFYSIYSATTLKELMVKVLDFIKSLLEKAKEGED